MHFWLLSVWRGTAVGTFTFCVMHPDERPPVYQMRPPPVNSVASESETRFSGREALLGMEKRNPFRFPFFHNPRGAR